MNLFRTVPELTSGPWTSVLSWNINGVRKRTHLLQELVERLRPDIIALQEVRSELSDELESAILDLGYIPHWNAFGGANGVAFATRINATRFELPSDLSAEGRAISLRVGSTLFINIYAPNAADCASEAFERKTEWYRHLYRFTRSILRESETVVILGDFNIAPNMNAIHPECHREFDGFMNERMTRVWNELAKLGLHPPSSDVNQYTWWSYRNRSFERGVGMWIDHLLTSEKTLSQNLVCSAINDIRARPATSDHVPIFAKMSAPLSADGAT